jgi:RNA polymerase sigma-70 factor (ECF subfamily)
LQGILFEVLLGSVAMLPESATPPDCPALGSIVAAAIARRYDESGGRRYGITPERFHQIAAAVVVRYAPHASEADQVQLVAMLRVAELTLARACSEGNELAWEEFLTRFRAPLYETGYRIAKDEATGREIADGLYADLYGMPNRAGHRVSKLDYYTGRGPLEAWLRTVLAQQYVDRYRAQRRDVSLDEQLEMGASFAAKPLAPSAQDDRVASAVAESLAGCSEEERFLLASYYLDGQTLADIGRQLRVHESTVSRKLARLAGDLRKRVKKRLKAAGVDGRQCDELLQGLDVRDLDVNIEATLRQESSQAAFYKEASVLKKDGPAT